MSKRSPALHNETMHKEKGRSARSRAGRSIFLKGCLLRRSLSFNATLVPLTPKTKAENACIVGWGRTCLSIRASHKARPGPGKREPESKPEDQRPSRKGMRRMGRCEMHEVFRFGGSRFLPDRACRRYVQRFTKTTIVKTTPRTCKFSDFFADRAKAVA